MTDLDLLVLGGTSWLGGAAARAGLERGHRVTCLARGEAGNPPDGVTWVRADRRSPEAYDAVADRSWDVVVDVSWQPDLVRSALHALGRRTRHWVYVSSSSVYADDSVPGTDESAPLHPAHEGTGEVDREVYGPAKVSCEEACVATMGPEHVLLARAGLIGGYGDRSDRLGYWPARFARSRPGEPVLVPPLGSAFQVVDVEDLAEWLVAAGEQRVSGAVNAVGEVTTLREALDLAASVAGAAPHLVETSDAWLVERGVQPWAGDGSLPLWLPQPDYAGFMTRRNDAARGTGLMPRPLLDTLAATLRWERECGVERSRRAGLTRAREAELLAEHN